MRRIKLLLGIICPDESTVEFMVSAEITKLTKITPRTKAEKSFHAWLLSVREQNLKTGKK